MSFENKLADAEDFLHEAKDVALATWSLLILLFDQTSRVLNVLTGPIWNHFTKTRNFGYHKNTLSACLGKTWPDCQFCQAFCYFVSFVGRDDKHCREAASNWVAPPGFTEDGNTPST